MSEINVFGLPEVAIQEDHRLEQGWAKSTLALMKHRWHWTLDESNPERVSIRQYAADVGREKRTIGRYANAYPLFEEAGRRAAPIDLGELLERAGMSPEKYAAIEAVAKLRGLAPRTVREKHPAAVRAALQIARARAGDRGTTVTTELPGAAEEAVVFGRPDVITPEQRVPDSPNSILLRHLARAERALQEATTILADPRLLAQIDQEEQGEPAKSLDRIQEVSHAARRVVGGRDTPGILRGRPEVIGPKFH